MAVQDIYVRAKTLLAERPIEICIGAALGGLIAFYPSYVHERAKLGQIPLAFSEIGQTKKCFENVDLQKSDFCDPIIAKKYGQITQLPPLTEYYATLNDMFMMIAESNNIARSGWQIRGHRAINSFFAFELEKKIEFTFRVHNQFPEYASHFGAIAGAAKKAIEPLSHARRDIVPAIQSLGASWEDEHQDRTRTEYYTEEECSTDSNGERECETVTKSREVYDHTDHYYYYYPEQGQKATTDLQTFFQHNPDIKIGEQLIQTWRTNADNEMAMRDSRMHLSNYKTPTDKDYLTWANVWATGSNYMTFSPQIYTAFSELQKDSSAWQKASRTARSVSYSTNSSSDDGPREFQTARTALEQAETMAKGIAKIEDGINVADKTIPALNDKIARFVNAEMHHQGEPGHLGSEIIHDAQGLYAQNYENGFDVSPAKWWHTVLWTLFGVLAAGGLAGVTGDWYAYRQNPYPEMASRFRQNHLRY